MRSHQINYCRKKLRMRSVTKIQDRTFRVTISEVPNEQLILDFNPIIEKFKLQGNYQLIHWQAKPKGYREWGIYSSVDDSYQSVPNFAFQGIFKSLQVPDEEIDSVPTSVILIRK
jgi:hypothetical protein